MRIRVDHVGIAVRDLEERLGFWRDLLGLEVTGSEIVESEGVEVTFLAAGEARVELLRPTRSDSPVGRFLEKRGEGIHHLTLAVPDVGATLGRLRDAGAPVLDESPRTGAGGTRVAFVHPRAAGGVLVELVERRDTAATLTPGQAVLVYLRDPQEKLWGVLRRIDGTGITLEGIELPSFDDWVAQVERGEESGVGPSLLFYPMLRVERVLLDRSTGPIASLSERFERRTGRTVQQVLGAG